MASLGCAAFFLRWKHSFLKTEILIPSPWLSSVHAANMGAEIEAPVCRPFMSWVFVGDYTPFPFEE